MNIKQDSDESQVKQIKRISLAQLKIGTSANVFSVKGEKEVVSKIEAMGITAGATIKKISASLFHGPIILEKDFMQIALGYDMAKQIIVEISD